MVLLSAIPALPVRDLTRALRFYEQTLGFALRHIGDDFAIVKRDGVEIHLWMAWTSHRHDGLPTPVGSATCKIHVSGLARLYAELEQRKVVHPEGHLAIREGNTADFTILDGDGNALLFFEVEPTP
jgi:catechol 2,3-dioxygenase-like lactoylglutathione lyase family enzyme